MPLVYVLPVIRREDYPTVGMAMVDWPLQIANR
jgi:hypothetical protein